MKRDRGLLTGLVLTLAVTAWYYWMRSDGGNLTSTDQAICLAVIALCLGGLLRHVVFLLRRRKK